MTVSQIVAALIEHPDQPISIQGDSKDLAGLAEFKTVNQPNSSYFKATFQDHSSMCLIPSDNFLLYSEDAPQKFVEIADEDIGTKTELSFRGKEYVLDNANDYQYVIRLIKGDHSSIEGEVRFSDYLPKDGSSEMLSVGWVVRTGERADVNPKELNPDEITLSQKL